MRRIHVMGMTALALAAIVVTALAAAPGTTSGKAPTANANPRHAAPAQAGMRGDVPELMGDEDGIEPMDGPDAWDRLGMGPAGLEVPGGRGRAGAGLRMRAMAERRLELAKQLDLTAEQRNRIGAIHDRQQRLMIEQRAKLELAHLDLRTLLRADPPNRAALEAKSDEISRLEAQMRKARLGTMLDLRDVLTAEQRAKLEALREEMGGGYGRK